MAEEKDQSQKTHEPTQHRLEEARKKGQVILSQDLSLCLMLFASGITVLYLMPLIAQWTVQVLLPYIDHPHDVRFETVSISRLIWQTIKSVGLFFALPSAVFIGAALSGTYLQTRFAISTERLKPKFSKISPGNGFKRIYSGKALIEFLKGSIKLWGSATLLVYVLWPELETTESLMFMGPYSWLLSVKRILFKSFSAVILLMIGIAVLDYFFQRYKYYQELKMTPQELKEEHKQLEGDPVIKGRIRQIRNERARARLADAVKKANVIVTNPTHFAVALEYHPPEVETPVVVAKGVDFMALNIRKLAKEYDIPIVENKPLARALYDNVKVGKEIKPEHYKAVAEVIRFIMALKGRMKPKPY